MFSRRNSQNSGNSSKIPRATSTSDSQRRSSSLPRSGATGGYVSAVMRATSRIDPQILLDTQSNGLSSRIVKYHEENQRTSRTPRYKPGQFPIVHFKKNEIVYSTKRNNPLSAVKIAPPDKSVSDRNLRLNILQQGLTPRLPLEDYHPRKILDNEPLTPSAEDVEPIPTRSVLDALTEISRKRIHHEDFIIEERSKKPCKDTTEVDSGSLIEMRKRQREKTSPVTPTEVHKGVESNQKKICRDSNDILSSLSSSVRLLNPKRRLDEVFVTNAKRTNHQQTPKVALEQRKQSPPVPAEKRTSADLIPTPKIQQKTSPQQIDQEISVVKSTPKVTLFNQNYDKIQNRNLLDDDEEEAGKKSMNFIRPKKDSLLLVRDKDVSKKGTKSKLALMLSYLSRNFDDDSTDVVDSKDEITVSTPSPILPKENSVKVTEAPIVPILPVSTNSGISNVVSSQAETVPTTVTTSSLPAVEVKSPEKSVPIFPIKFDTPFKVIETSTNNSVVNPSVQVIPASAENQPKEETCKKTPEVVTEVKAPMPQSVLTFPSVSASNLTSSTAPPLISLTPATPAPTLSFPANLGGSFLQKSPTTTASTLGLFTNKALPSVPAISTAPSVNFNFGTQSQQPPATTAGPAVVSNPVISTPSVNANSFFTFKPAVNAQTTSSNTTSTSFAPTMTSAPATAPLFNFGGQTKPAAPISSESQFGFPGNASSAFGDLATKPKDPIKFDASMYCAGIRPPTSSDFISPFTPQAATPVAPQTPSFTSNSNVSMSGTAFTGFGTTTTASSTVFAPKTTVETKNLFTFGPTTTTTAASLTFSSSTTSAQKFPSTFETVASVNTPMFGGNQGNLISNPPAVTTTPSIFSSQGMSGFPAPKFGITTSAASAISTGASVFAPSSSPFGGFNQQQQKAPGASEWGKSPFSGFGGASTTPSNPATTTTSSGSPFTFGGVIKQQPATTPSSVPGIFGASQTPSNAFGSMDKPFSFSGGSAAPTPFEATPTTTGVTSSPFSFGGTNSGSTFTFGQTPTPAPSVFGSGASVFGGTTNPPPPPSYEASTAPPAFNFGASATPIAQPSAQPFVFGQSNPPGTPGMPGNPIFSIGSNGGGAPQRRPFRTATRRLNK
ncbi:hypothetical protein DMENIID0001_164790 [Sergentomyia squamirostris]